MLKFKITFVSYAKQDTQLFPRDLRPLPLRNLLQKIYQLIDWLANIALGFRGIGGSPTSRFHFPD